MFSYNNGPSVMREMTQCNVPDVAFSEKVPQMVGLQCTEKIFVGIRIMKC